MLIHSRGVKGLISEHLPPLPQSRESWGIVLLPLFIAVVLLLLDRYGVQQYFMQEHAGRLVSAGMDINQVQFLAQLWFSAANVLLFIVLPLAFHFCFPVSFDNALGWRLPARGAPWGVYALLVVLMAPVAWVAAASPAFHDFYPMYKPSDAGQWLVYEAVYLLQFVCIEFFFRGFALFRLEARFGLHAVTLMVIPYALIHVHKPLSEALAAVVAGVVLGLLAVKSRSIWPGVMIHCSVALMMDVFALYHAGRLLALF